MIWGTELQRMAMLKGWIAIGMMAPAVATAAPAPLSAYGQLPEVSDIALAPDGSAIAAMIGTDDKRGMRLLSLPDLKLVTFFRTGDAKIRSLRWAGPDHVVLTYSTTAKALNLEGDRHEWFLAIEYNVKTGKWDKLLDMVPGAMNVVLSSPVALTDGKRDAIGIEGASLKENVTVSTLFRIDLGNHLTKQLDTGSVNTVDWVIGPDGHGVARADYRQSTGEWTLFVRPKGSNNFKRTPTIVAPIDRPALLGYGRTTDTVLVSQLGEDGWQTHEVSLADGSWSEPLAELNSDNVLRDGATQTVIGSLSTDMAGYNYQFLDPADQKLWMGLQKAFAGETVSFVDWSDDRMVAIVEVEGPKNGDAFFLVDRRTKKADWIADRYRAINPESVSERRVITYKAADGFEIPAYLTLPRGRGTKGLPLVVLPHGGPASRDNPGFDWWSQALASRGYAVLQPQFRGSDGFGTAHLAAGYGEWGRKMQTDLSDGVRQLVRDGIADPGRVCIVGASYGGYAALAGVTFDAGLYRCAISIAGVSDLRRMLQSESRGYFGSRTDTVRYWQRFMGAKSLSDASVDAWSPALRANAIKVPVLLIHGKDDTVVPYAQSTVMAEAMKAAGGSVDLVTLQAEDHWLSRGPTRSQMLFETVAFLEKHNPPGAAAAGK
jgi:dipeptidyl aminopeptidase/acylaminoacyl peptidase